MRSFANAVVLLVALTTAGAAQTIGAVPAREPPRPPRTDAPVIAASATDTSPRIPGALAQRVAAAIANQWGDDASALQLVWGRVSRSATFPAATDVRLVGRGDGGWFVAVFSPGSTGPFAVRVRAGGRDSAIVAARTVEAGHVLSAEDLRIVPRTRWGPPAEAATPHVTAGWVAKRVLMVGAEVPEGSVMPPPLVHPGDAVVVEWRRGAVLITLEGTALDAGGAGQTVRVRIGQNRGAKNGTVLATGIVRLDS